MTALSIRIQRHLQQLPVDSADTISNIKTGVCIHLALSTHFLAGLLLSFSPLTMDQYINSSVPFLLEHMSLDYNVSLVVRGIWTMHC